MTKHAFFPQFSRYVKFDGSAFGPCVKFDTRSGMVRRMPSILLIVALIAAQLHAADLVQHGVDVGPHNTGLVAAGVTADDLKPSPGGRASRLANGTDEGTGWPMLSRLDITGSLTIDAPCVIEHCRLTADNAWYGVRNDQGHKCILRDCDLHGPLWSNGRGICASVVLYPSTMQRCVITGGSDGIKFGPTDCLIEDCWIHSQIATPGSHNDAMQMSSGRGDYDSYIIRRCRIEGPFREPTSALIVGANANTGGHSSGVTLDSCFLSGGGWTLYLRQTAPYTLSRVTITGCYFAEGAAKWGYLSTDGQPVEWANNWLVPLTDWEDGSAPVQVDISRKRRFVLGGR